MTQGERPLTIAVPKGRILSELRPLFQCAGIDLSLFSSDSRKLLVETPDYRVILLRASDVPTYVTHGVADLGVCGADTLVEGSSDLLEPLDLGIGRCRLVIAAPTPNALSSVGWVRVATTYPNIAQRYFRRRGIDARIIRLSGSVELACLAGLADVVVDLVSTGETLRANNLLELSTIMGVTARLVVNRASAKTRFQAIDGIIEALSAAVNNGEAT